MRAYTPVYGSRGSLSYVTGSHAIKTGYTLVMGDYEQTSTPRRQHVVHREQRRAERR